MTSSRVRRRSHRAYDVKFIVLFHWRAVLGGLFIDDRLDAIAIWIEDKRSEIIFALFEVQYPSSPSLAVVINVCGPKTL